MAIPILPGSENAPRTRSWQFPHSGMQGPWLGSLRLQLDRYLFAVSVATCRNRGPKGRGSNLTEKKWLVVRDFIIPSGSVWGDERVPIPDGAVLKGKPVLPPFFSRRQGRKALAAAQLRWPDARLVRIAHHKEYRMVSSGSIEVPTGCGDWWARRPSELKAAGLLSRSGNEERHPGTSLG